MAISDVSQIIAVSKVVKHCQESKFWGKVTIIIADGNVVEMISSQTLKPEKVLSGVDQVMVSNNGKEKKARNQETAKNIRQKVRPS